MKATSLKVTVSGSSNYPDPGCRSDEDPVCFALAENSVADYARDVVDLLFHFSGAGKVDVMDI